MINPMVQNYFDGAFEPLKPEFVPDTTKIYKQGYVCNCGTFKKMFVIWPKFHDDECVIHECLKKMKKKNKKGKKR